jgi:hypothetical protein
MARKVAVGQRLTDAELDERYFREREDDGAGS